MTGALLFAAFAFFAFAQAASARNGAQSAADAAALAAAQSARDELLVDLGQALDEGEDWLRWLEGLELDGQGAADAAGQLAAANDADLVGGPDPAEVNGYPGYWVEVQTRYTVGDTIIPGTENDKAKAHATAVVKPRCDVPVDADPKKPVQLTCDDEKIEIDPDDFDLDDLPDASTFFSVHLAD